MQKKNNSILQDWLPIEKILEGGIIKKKNNEYIKIIKVKTINYNLKSNMEKESILNSYKIFLKTCNFDFQILIQSKKEDLSNNILEIQKNLINENEKIKNIGNKYIEFIQKINNEKKSSSKNIFLIIKNEKQNKTNEENIIQELNNNYFKIKENLLRCGNLVSEISKKETIDILISFLNSNNN